MLNQAVAQIIPFPVRRTTQLPSPMQAPEQAADRIADSTAGQTVEPTDAQQTGTQQTDARQSDAQQAGAERLARALASLNAALADQRVAVAAWRGTLSQLKTTTDGLRSGLQRYHSALGDLSTRVATLGNDARKLEAWADGVLTQE